MQQEHLFAPIDTSRKAARRIALDAAKARGEVGIERAAEKVEALHAGWCTDAVERLRRLAVSTHPGLFTIEQARLVINLPAPSGGDLRAWGRVTQQAVKLGFIKRTGKTLPAASSNGSEKPLFTKGPNAC